MLLRAVCNITAMIIGSVCLAKSSTSFSSLWLLSVAFNTLWPLFRVLGQHISLLIYMHISDLFSLLELSLIPVPIPFATIILHYVPENKYANPFPHPGSRNWKKYAWLYSQSIISSEY